MASREIARVLIVHGSASARAELEQVLRRIWDGPVAVCEAGTLPEAVEISKGFSPSLVLACVRVLAGAAGDALFGPGRNVVAVRDAGSTGVGLVGPERLAGVVELPVADADLLRAVSASAKAGSGASRRQAFTIAFVGHKGGVGRTTLAVNTATALARMTLSGEVALLDGVLQMGTAGSFLGLAPHHDISGFALERERDPEALVAASLVYDAASGVHLLASPQDPLTAPSVGPEDLAAALADLKRRFAVVVVDTAAHLDLATFALLDMADRLYVVTEAVTPTVLWTARYLELLAGEGFERERLRIVVNRHAAFAGNLDRVVLAKHLGGAPDHIIPEERNVVVAAKEGVPLVRSDPRCRFSQAVQVLATEVADGPARSLGTGRGEVREMVAKG